MSSDTECETEAFGLVSSFGLRHSVISGAKQVVPATVRLNNYLRTSTAIFVVFLASSERHLKTAAMCCVVGCFFCVFFCLCVCVCVCVFM